MTTARDYARAVNPDHCAPLPGNPSHELPTLSAEVLCLWARNTGELYAAHLALANANASPARWRAHVDHELLPRYRREIERVQMDCAARDTAARCLLSYYWRHKLETERLAGAVSFPCRHGYQANTTQRKGA